MSHERGYSGSPDLNQPQDESPSSIMDRPVSRRSVLKGIAGAFGAAVVNNFPLSEVAATPHTEDTREVSDQEHSEALPQAEGLTGIQAFDNVWSRTDRLVASDKVRRSWLWGPDAFDIREESYAESPGEKRLVAYFDKSRMEITHPEGDSDSDWYVTNGLLVNELITGRMQTGDNTFVERAPADVQVVGDPDVGNLTYAVLAKLLPPQEQRERGTSIVERVNNQGEVSFDPSTGSYDVKLSDIYIDATGHQVAQPFYDFMTSRGPIIDRDGNVVEADLMPSPFYATGYPTTDPYWCEAIVAGEKQDVLVQAFERRVLTYTPTNPDGWKVEAGNVGRHYHEWRGEEAEPGCGVEERETVGDLNDGQGVMIVNKECSRYWFENGDDPSNDLSAVDKAIQELHPGEKWQYVLWPNRADVPPKEYKPEVGLSDNYNSRRPYDSNWFPGLGEGTWSITYKDGIFQMNEALPDNFVDYYNASDDALKEALKSAVATQAVAAVFSSSHDKGDSSKGGMDPASRKKLQEILAIENPRPLKFEVA